MYLKRVHDEDGNTKEQETPRRGTTEEGNTEEKAGNDFRPPLLFPPEGVAQLNGVVLGNRRRL